MKRLFLILFLLVFAKEGFCGYAPIPYDTNTMNVPIAVHFTNAGNTFVGSSVVINGTNILNLLMLSILRDGSTPLTASWNVGNKVISNFTAGAGSTWNGNIITSNYLDLAGVMATNASLLGGYPASYFLDFANTTNVLSIIDLEYLQMAGNINLGTNSLSPDGLSKGISLTPFGEAKFSTNLWIHGFVRQFDDNTTKFGFFATNRYIIDVRGYRVFDVLSPGSVGAFNIGNPYFNFNVNSNMFFVGTNGNVGVNTVVPAYQLDVNGTVRATSYLGDGSFLTGISATSTNSVSYIAAPGTTNSPALALVFEGNGVTDSTVANGTTTVYITSSFFTNKIGSQTYTNTGFNLQPGTGMSSRITGGTNYMDSLGSTVSRYTALATADYEILVKATGSGITASVVGTDITFTIPSGVVLLSARIRWPASSGSSTFTLNLGTSDMQNTSFANRWGACFWACREDTGAFLPTASCKLDIADHAKLIVSGLITSAGVVNHCMLEF